jgi:hypothetical protein
LYQWPFQKRFPQFPGMFSDISDYVPGFFSQPFGRTHITTSIFNLSQRGQNSWIAALCRLGPNVATEVAEDAPLGGYDLFQAVPG